MKTTGTDSKGLGLEMMRVLAPTRNPSNTIGEERREEKRNICFYVVLKWCAMLIRVVLTTSQKLEHRGFI